MKKLTFAELRSIMCEHERTHPEAGIVGYVVFKAENWPEDDYSLEERTYAVSSKNKAFMPNMGGYSIYAAALAGPDKCVRLDWYIQTGSNPDGWEVDYCYMEGDK